MTASMLGCGLLAMKRGDSKKQQFFMRGRVLAQGFTLGVLVFGMLYTANSNIASNNSSNNSS